MQMIPESIIDELVLELEENPATLQEGFQIFDEEQPALLAYLLSESFEILTKDERDLMLYMAVVIFLAFKRSGNSIPTINEEAIGQTEERNWELMISSKASKFRDRLTPFFENYPQEDLLAFVEDALTIDEEEELVTKEGREPIFVGLRSIIDVLSPASS